MEINQAQKLNPKLFTEDIEQVPIRQGFGEGLLSAGERDPRIVALCADLTDSTKMSLFVKKFPKRFIEIGVAEQNLATVASGLSAVGKIPVISSYAMFSPGRNWEQIRTTICYNNRPVKIAGSHAGVSVGPDGGTHQAVEDIAIMRVIPRMQVIVPCDSIEAKKAILAMTQNESPAYVRLAREKTPLMTTEDSPFEIGKANMFIDAPSPQVTIVGCGAVLYNALIAADMLAKEGVIVSVMNNHSVKPIDTNAIIAAAKRSGAIVTIEEHQRAGGMGSAVAEALASHHPVPIEFLGVDDRFGQSGTPEELVEHYGLGASSIVEAVKRVIARKK
ncbi:MAG: transketolase family protein [Candidatus Vogelbacteria bacterium]|nr:transketolase family protein [Candidatus Vogelbacteria bacterium]